MGFAILLKKSSKARLKHCNKNCQFYCGSLLLKQYITLISQAGLLEAYYYSYEHGETLSDCLLW